MGLILVIVLVSEHDEPSVVLRRNTALYIWLCKGYHFCFITDCLVSNYNLKNNHCNWFNTFLYVLFRNVSLVAGMCPHGQWEKVTKGSWARSMSLFDHKILDVRTAGSTLENFEVSVEEGKCSYVYVCLTLFSGKYLFLFVSKCLLGCCTHNKNKTF